MKKIFVDKSEDTNSIVKKIQAAPDEEIVLVIPRNAMVKSSLTNLRRLKEEAEGFGQTILIESVDDDILALAKEANVEAVHPLLSARRSGSGGPSLADIRPTHAQADEEVGPPPVPLHQRGRNILRGLPKVSLPAMPKLPGFSKLPSLPKIPLPQFPRRKGKTVVIDDVLPPETDDEVLQDMPVVEEEMPASRTERELIEREEYFNDDFDGIKEPPRRRRRWILHAVFASVVLGLIIWGVGALFGWATVTLDFKETAWSRDTTVSADKAVGSVDVQRNAIPGEMFTQEKNFTQSFPASSRQNVSQKASGTIRIVNAYGAQSQPLVATTRFMTEDGKIYRLTQAVTVPAARVENGQVIPTSIEANVEADQPGEAYNLSGNRRLAIPGFQGTPKYTGFYGELIRIDGGLIGERAVPTAQDIEQAKQRVTDTLKASFSNSALNRPNGLVILPDASQIEIKTLTVSSSTDAAGNFTVLGEAILQAVAFRESDIKEFIENTANQELSREADSPQLVFREFTIEYPQVQADFAQGTLQLTARATGVLAPMFSAEEFIPKMLGKDLDEVRAMTAQLPGLDQAKISIWPFWLSSLPETESRIHLTVE